MRAFTILRLRRLPDGSGHGYSGHVVCTGQSETFSVLTEGGSLVVTLAGIETRLSLDPFVAMRCHWPEIGETVRSGLAAILNDPRYTAQRQMAQAA